MKTSNTTFYELSIEEVKQAINFWMKNKYNLVIGCIHEIKQIERKEYYKISNFEDDYNTFFDGLKVTVK